MQCPVVQAAVCFDDSPALIDSSRTVTFREFDLLIRQQARRLSDIGIGARSRVGILLPNSIDQIILFMALIRLKALACPVSTRLPLAGIESCLQKVGGDLLVTESRSRHVPNCRSISIGDISARTGTPVTFEENLSSEQPAAIVFTSGSTGEPKAALLTLGNLYYNALGSNQNIPFGPGDRWLLSLPLYHVGGLGILFRALAGGGATVVDNSAVESGESIVRHSVTHLSLVFTQARRLLRQIRAREVAPRQLKAVLLGGSGMQPEMIRQCAECCLPIHTSYGLTEMASQVTSTPLGAPLEALLTSGKLLPYRELRISASGEIMVRGETRFAGYVDGQSLIVPIDSDGWYATGDIGSIDGDGYLTVIGRIDTMFISGGENIYPEEIEKALQHIDGVQHALVVPVAHPEYGFRPVAFVEVDQSRAIDRENIAEMLREFLPPFKIPDRIYPWPTGAVSAGLKPDRKSFAALAQRLCDRHH